MTGLLVITAISAGVTCIIGGIILKKLSDVHKEIMYFEEAKGVYRTKKEHDRLENEYWKNYYKKTESK